PGAYCECAPPASRSGAIRPPTTAPTARPTSERPLQTKPCAAPPSAATRTSATASQSTTVTGLGYVRGRTGAAGVHRPLQRGLERSRRRRDRLDAHRRFG